MATNIIPFPSNGGLPAYLKKVAADTSAFRAGVSAGFPVLSIKGKVFTLVRGAERKMISRPDDPEEPASALELVLLAANAKLNKTFYENGYEEGAQDKPTCHSNDGVNPASDATEKQAKSCAACPHNVWGSGQNGKGKACSDNRRVAVAPAGRLDDPMLIRIPPASLKPLAEYAAEIDRHGLPLLAVVTKVRFDAEQATPKLVFSARGLLDEAHFDQAKEVAESELVAQIIGTAPEDMPAAPPVKAKAKPADVEDALGSVEDDEDEAPAPKAKPKAKANMTAAVVEDDEEEAPPPKAKPKAKPKPAPVEEEDEAPAPKAKAAKPALSDLDDEIDGLLSDFDD